MKDRRLKRPVKSNERLKARWRDPAFKAQQLAIIREAARKRKEAK
jgi:hypothetical protein